MPNETKPKAPRFELSPLIRLQTGPDGGTVLDLRGNRCYHLNVIGCLILKELLAGNSLAQVVDHLAAQCSVEAERVLGDVEQFIRTLVEKKWIVDEERGRGNPLLARIKRACFDDSPQ